MVAGMSEMAVLQLRLSQVVIVCALGVRME